jgi:hypothetical protein
MNTPQFGRSRRAERYLCKSCHRIMYGNHTRMQYSPIKSRRCEYCGGIVVKALTRDSLRYVEGLIRGGAQVARERA